MNIYDIAEKAGVSIATVSRVVNGSNKVSEKTRNKVMAIIEETDYTPNVFAQGLGLDSMHSIGVLVPGISDAYLSQAVSHIEEKLHKNGYDMILGCSGYEAAGKESHIKMLIEKRIDALMLVGSTYAGSEDETHNTDHILQAAKSKPLFLINGMVDGENIYCTGSNDYQASYDATSSLLNSGHKKILFLTDSRSYSANQKKAGYIQAHKDIGKLPSEKLMIHTKNDISVVKNLLLDANLKFDGVFATDDGMAVGAIKYAIKKGIRIPDDINIIGYNNSSLCICSNPELTSVDNRLEKVCNDSIDRMIAVLNKDPNVISQKQIVACSLIKRQTTNF
ncbi:MAG: LacI family transcriptional regulator [Eubacterium sp.]|nr:LacI family transcriptional regulator [Eubacterium sp.]